MSVLDTLYILFKSHGAKEVKEDHDKIKKSSDDVEKSLKNSDNAVNKLDNSLGHLAKELGAIAASYFSIRAILEGFKNSVDYASQIEYSSELLKINTEVLDAWSNAVLRTGGSAKGFSESLRNLSNNLWVTGDTALKILPQLADSFQKMGRNASFQYGKTLGLDEATILLLQKGRREVDAIIARQKELGLVTKKDAAIVREFNFQWQDTNHSLRSLFWTLAADILPILSKFLKSIEMGALYFREHSEVIKGSLIAIGIAAGLMAIGIAAANIEIVAITVAIGAAIAAFGLLYEDIRYFIKGNESMIGHILERWPEVGKAVRATVDEFERFFKFLDRIYEKYYKIISLGKNFRIYGEYGDQGVDDRSINTPNTLQQRIMNINNSINAVNRSRLLTQSPVGSFGIANNRNSEWRSYVVNTGPITVETQATDGIGVAQSLSRTLDDQLKQAINDFDDGVMI
jgi:hypothetical protein